MWTFAFYAILVIGLLLSLPPILRTQERYKLTPDIRARASGQFVLLSRGQTHYEVAGPENGPVAVLIHGFSVPYYMWDPTFKALADAGFRVIRYDLYGRGFSDRPKVDYNRALFVGQLYELLESLGIKEPVHLIANSMGGAIAAAFVASYPQKVAKVTLIDPWNQKWEIGLFNLPGIGEYLTAAFFLPQAPHKQLGDFYRPENFPDWPERFQEQMRYQGFGTALLSTLRHFMSQDPLADYQKIRQAQKPVLLLWGTEDRVTPPQGVNKLKPLLDPEFHWVEQAGHVPHYERPEVVNPYLIQFLTPSPADVLPENRPSFSRKVSSRYGEDFKLDEPA